jgi:hypothetical protein
LANVVERHHLLKRDYEKFKQLIIDVEAST